MSFQKIVGQEQAKKQLQAGLRFNKVAHAYLFSGPQGTGRMTMALTFAQALFCERMTEDACGKCFACRKIEQGNHPDVHVVVPDNQSIKIDQIRELQRKFSYLTSAKGYKVYIMQQAEKMTVQATNCLLTFLEEPVSLVVAVLITENRQAILPTLQSRTQLISFIAQTPLSIYKALVAEGCSAPLARTAMYLVNDWQEGYHLCHQTWFAEMRSIMLQLAQECEVSVSRTLVTVQQQICNTELVEHTDMLFRLFYLWFRDMLYYQYGRQQSLVFINQLDTISKLAWTKSAMEWIRCMSITTEAQKRVRANVNPQLACEQFLISMQGGA